MPLLQMRKDNPQRGAMASPRPQSAGQGTGIHESSGLGSGYPKDKPGYRGAVQGTTQKAVTENPGGRVCTGPGLWHAPHSTCCEQAGTPSH